MTNTYTLAKYPDPSSGINKHEMIIDANGVKITKPLTEHEYQSLKDADDLKFRQDVAELEIVINNENKE